MVPATPCDAAPRARWQRARHVAPLVVTALLTITVGCGGDDASSDPTRSDAGTSPTSSESDSAPATGSTLPTQPSADTDPSQSVPSAATVGEPVGSDHTVFEAGDIDEGLRPFVERARDDLAVRLAVDRDDIELLTAVLVVWPNSALGCPDPKRRYTQVPVDGSVIELGVGDRVYRYHTGGASELFLCERPWNASPAAGGPSRVETNSSTGSDDG